MCVPLNEGQSVSLLQMINVHLTFRAITQHLFITMAKWHIGSKMNPQTDSLFAKKASQTAAAEYPELINYQPYKVQLIHTQSHSKSRSEPLLSYCEAMNARVCICECMYVCV